MKILMLRAYFYPENASGIGLTNDLIAALADAGHDVVVYAPIPSRGVDDCVRNSYKKTKSELVHSGKVIIKRYWLPKERRNVFLRAFRYGLQNLIQIIKALNTEFDVVYLSSTPPTMGLVGVILKKITNKSFIYNVQDVFPDSLVTTGITKKDSFLYNVGSYIMNITYKCADYIVVISDSMKKNLEQKGVSSKKISVIPNWIDVEKIVPVEKEDNYLYSELSLDKSKFYVVYAGNLGYAQNIEIILKAARVLKERDNIQFLIFGRGAQEKEYLQMATEMCLDNVKFYQMRPVEEISYVYSLGDVSLITCKKGAGMSAMPSKTWNIMACNKPIIASFDTESDLASIISKANAGSCIEPDNEYVLAAEIEKYVGLNRNEYMLNSRRYVMSFAAKEVCTKEYIKIISQEI